MSGEELLREFTREVMAWTRSGASKMPTKLVESSNQLTGWLKKAEKDHLAMKKLRDDNGKETVWCYHDSTLFKSFGMRIVNTTRTPHSLDPADAILGRCELQPTTPEAKPIQRFEYGR